MKPRVLLDVDGVIADLAQVFVKTLARETGIRKTTSDVTQFDFGKALGITPSQVQRTWRAMNGAAMVVKPYPGAVEGVKKLMEVANVVFCTSPVKSDPRWCYDRTQWLIEHFGSAQARKVVYTSEKYVCQGDFLVDDKPENLELWHEEAVNRTPVLWDQLWNKDSELPRMNDWGKLLEVVKRWAIKFPPVEQY